MKDTLQQKEDSLSNTLAVILDDPGILKELCGPQDENLKILEGLLEVPIFIRGNEILLASDREPVQQKFQNLLEKMVDYADQGNPLSPEVIRAFYESLEEPEGDPDLVKNQFIQLPGGTRILPRTYRQARYLEGMESKDLVFCIGPAGTGKTFLAVAYALREILEKRRRKLILTRPVVEAGESLGFLPGDLAQKVSPYLRPLYDAMDMLISPEAVQKMEENRVIEIAPLAYMRGRSLKDCFIILDEAQNTTREQMKMFLTRMGEGAKMVITGDVTQIDLPKKDRSGLIHAAGLLKSIGDIGFYQFQTRDVIRHPLVKKIIEAYEKEN